MIKKSTPYEEGDPESKICIVGEAPSNVEIKMNQPLVGPSGQVLEECMHAAKMVRRECYLLNIWPFKVKKERKTGNIQTLKGDLLWSNRKSFTPLGLDAAKVCLERLAKCSANVIVPLGGTALDLLYSDTRITRWRGSILRSHLNIGRGSKLMPTIHPAASLRGQYIYRYMIINDLEKAKKESEYHQIILPKRSLIIRPTFNFVMDYLTDIQKNKEKVASDVEVLNHQISCYCMAPSKDESLCIPLVGEGGKHYWKVEEEVQIWYKTAKILSNPNIMKINQNNIFDMYMYLATLGIRTRGPIGDPMIAHHIMFPDFPKGLDFLCSVLTEEPYYKDDGKLWSKPWRDLDLFWRYNARDGACAFECWNMCEDLMDDSYRQTYEETVGIFDFLLFMQLRGFNTDRDKLKETKQRVSKIISEKIVELKEVSGAEINFLSSTQCCKYFYDILGYSPYKSYKTGNRTCDDKALSRIIKRYNSKEARIIQELRSLSKLSTTYLSMGIDKDNRIRSTYNPRGTRTGRLSSSQTIFGTGGNMQNMHAEFKQFLVAG